MLPQPADAAGRHALPAAEGELSREQFARLSTLIEARCGIRMPPGKKVMLERRLRKRLRALDLDDFGAYCARVLGGDEEELVHMVDEVTTNKTDFFREPVHFDYLTRTALPGFAARGDGAGEPLRVWSAACSTGEEPWTLAMVLAEFTARQPGFRWQILATDICTEVLAHARSATYAEERVAPVPQALRQKYLLRRKDGTPVVRIVPGLRERVRFRRQNLLAPDLERAGPHEVIFCRNVLIYFQKQVQQSVLQRFVRCLVPGGLLVLGHSETINGHDLPLVQVAPTVYRKPEAR